MSDLPLYKQLYKQLKEQKQYDEAAFIALYNDVSTQLIRKQAVNRDVQNHFQMMIGSLLTELPAYYDCCIKCIEQEELDAIYKQNLLQHLEVHCGPDNIHRIVIDFNNKTVLKAALDKMYQNLFDTMKRFLLTHLFDSHTVYRLANEITHPGSGVFYTYEIIENNETKHSKVADRETEQKLFDALVQYPEFVPDVVNYLKLINAVHHTMGTESDLRYSDQRILFECPITALLKISAEYIPLLCECYAVFDKWHDVSALHIGLELVPSLYANAPEIIHLYSAAYGRALADYQLVETLEDNIAEKLKDKTFRRQFIPMLAAESLSSHISMHYENRFLEADELNEDLEDDLREDFGSESLAEHLAALCSAEEYDALKNLFKASLQQYIKEPEAAPFAIYPPDLSEITGEQLTERGYKKNKSTQHASVIYDTEAAAFWQFNNTDYLLACDEGWIRLINMESHQQVAVRRLPFDDESVYNIIANPQATDKSAVHFISDCNYLIQGWHMEQIDSKFTIAANVKHMFLSEDGSRLIIITDEPEEEMPYFNNQPIDIDLMALPENTLLCYDLHSLTETQRFAVRQNELISPCFSPDGSLMYTLAQGNENKLLVYDLKTGEIIKKHTGFGAYLMSNLVLTPDGEHIISDSLVYKLPEMTRVNTLQTFDFGDSFVSADGKYLASHGEMADNESTVAITEISSGRLVGNIHLKEETSLNNDIIFSANGKWMACLCDGHLYIYDFEHCIENRTAAVETFEITFPTVGSVTFYGSLITSIGDVRKNFINTTQNLSFEMLNFGKYAAQLNNAPAIPGRCPQSLQLERHIEECHTIIPEPGTTLGALLVAKSKGLQQSFDVRVRLTFPEYTDAETGESISQREWFQEVNAGETTFVGWQFTKPEEMLPGTWILEVVKMEEGMCLFQRLFTIEKPFETVDYQVTQKFCGLYSDPDISQKPCSTERTFVAKEGISFGLQFAFSCPGLENPYKIVGEIEHPLAPNPLTGELSTLTKRTFKLSDGNSIGLFRLFRNEDDMVPGTYTFRIIDPNMDKVLLEEALEILDPEDLDEPEWEIIDSGLYKYLGEGEPHLYKNYPKGTELECIAQDNSIAIDDEMIFGFRCRYKNFMGLKNLEAMVYHPEVSSLFGTETEEDFLFDLKDDETLFIGWVMSNSKYKKAGEWTIKVWEDEIDEDATPVFEQSFELLDA